MVGIYDWFGYDVSIRDRYKLIKVDLCQDLAQIKMSELPA